jgi:hypothetical protein
MYMQKKLLKKFNISKYDFLIEGAYALGSRIEFPIILLRENICYKG